MKADEKKLEKLVKDILRGKSVSSGDILYHWTHLASAGDRIVIRALNRQHGWQAFINWGSSDSLITARLESLVDQAGITDEALESLGQIGIVSAVSDSPRTRALWIRDAAASGRRTDWERARAHILHDPDLFEGVLDLLKEIPETAPFLISVLSETLSDRQDHLVRKALYRFEQRGVGGRSGAAVPWMERELFVFGENVLPQWQPILYFRTHSPFTDLGDLYVIQLQEGQDFEPPEKRENIRINSGGLLNLAQEYSQNVEARGGIKIPFHSISAGQARYFLWKSAALLEGTSGSRNIEDFLRFIGKEGIEDPFGPVAPTPAAVFPESRFFESWILNPQDLDDYFQRLDSTEQGPILLTGSNLTEVKHAAALEAFEKYFDQKNRSLWSLAFEKAAFFLLRTEPDSSSLALSISRALSDFNVSAKEIPSIAILWERSVEYAGNLRKAQEEQEKRESLIMTPGEFQQRYQRK